MQIQLRGIIWLLSCLACLAAHGQILIPATVEPYKPIGAKLQKLNVPPGALVRGSWSISGGESVQCDADTVHIWAPPGTYTVTASGVWVLTRLVKIEGQEVPILVDFGQYSESAKFTVSGGTPPVPPPVPGNRWGMIVEETAIRSPAQAALFLQVRQVFARDFLPIVDRSDYPSKWSRYVGAAGSSLPALVVIAADGSIVRSVKCPATVEALKQELAR